MKNFKIYAQALGLNMAWNSYPITIILRDGFGISIGGGSVFIALFWIVGILLLMPLNIFQRVFLPNKILTFFWLSFMLLCYIYLNYYTAHFYNYHITDLRETFTYLFPVLFLWALMYYPNDQVDKIVPITVIYSLIASVLFVYIVFSNPNFNLGERAAIKYANTANTTTNPHPFANNAVRCVIAAIICSFMTNNFFLKILNYFIAIFSIGVLFMTRTSTSLYGLAIMILIFISTGVFRINFSKIKFSTIAGVVVVLIFLNQLLKQSAKYNAMFDLYWSSISARFYNTLYTITGIKIGGSHRQVTEDASSMGRVISWNYVKTFLSEGSLENLILGEGYRSMFLDIPVLEAYINHGILGFLLYNAFFIALAVYVAIEFLTPATKWTSFLAYFSIIIFLNVTTGAPVVDTGNWMSFIPFIRFMGINYYSTNSLSSPLLASK